MPTIPFQIDGRRIDGIRVDRVVVDRVVLDRVDRVVVDWVGVVEGRRRGDRLGDRRVDKLGIGVGKGNGLCALRFRAGFFLVAPVRGCELACLRALGELCFARLRPLCGARRLLGELLQLDRLGGRFRSRFLIARKKAGIPNARFQLDCSQFRPPALDGQMSLF